MKLIIVICHEFLIIEYVSLIHEVIVWLSIKLVSNFKLLEPLLLDLVLYHKRHVAEGK